MTTAISLRMATQEDTDEIVALNPTHKISNSGDYWIIHDFLYRSITIAVESDGECETIVGMILDQEFRLHSLFVLPAYRRRGIATMLVQKIWDTNTRNNKLWEIHPTVWPIIDGIRRKIKNIGLYGYEMFTLTKTMVLCRYYTDPLLMNNVADRRYNSLWSWE